MKRVKNFFMVLLIYVCSLYHFVFSFMAGLISERAWSSWGNDSITENLGMQVIKLRSNLLPLYGFETFTLITCFIVFDYWLIRKPFNPKMNVNQFIDAFLFSQLAYLGYIFQFRDSIIGINAFATVASFFVLYLPMFVITFPLSLFLFKKRLKYIMPRHEEENNSGEQEKNSESKTFIIDYLIVWFIAFVSAIVAYWLNHNKVN